MGETRTIIMSVTFELIYDFPHLLSGRGYYSRKALHTG